PNRRARRGEPVRLSRLKRANVPYIANDVEHQLATAPGAPKPKPKPKPRKLSKLEQLDAEIKRCGWCGNWPTQPHVCQACRTNGHPIIHDYEGPASPPVLLTRNSPVTRHRPASTPHANAPTDGSEHAAHSEQTTQAQYKAAYEADSASNAEPHTVHQKHQNRCGG